MRIASGVVLINFFLVWYKGKEGDIFTHFQNEAGFNLQLTP